MSAELQWTFRTADASPRRYYPQQFADRALKAKTRIEQAVKQYRALKAAEHNIGNFDEAELNRLGYQLLGTDKSKDATRIFQLNAEAYPRSSNTWDSLAEAYMRDGNKPQAIAHDRKSLALNPNNRNAVFALQKLGALHVASAVQEHR